MLRLRGAGKCLQSGGDGRAVFGLETGLEPLAARVQYDGQGA